MTYKKDLEKKRSGHQKALTKQAFNDLNVNESKTYGQHFLLKYPWVSKIKGKSKWKRMFQIWWLHIFSGGGNYDDISPCIQEPCSSTTHLWGMTSRATFHSMCFDVESGDACRGADPERTQVAF